MKAIIPAAGLGTRFLPATKAQPKEMLPVLNKPVIQYVVEEAVAAGVDDVLIITGRGKRAIEDHFDRSVELEDLLERAGDTEKLRQVRGISELAEVFYVRQKRPRGLGHAVLCGAAHTGDQPFFVLLGDVIMPNASCLKRLREVHERYGASVIAVTPVEEQYVSRYGVIAGHEVEPGVWKVTDLVEKPAINTAPSNLAIFGRYLLTPKVMEILPHVEPGRGGEIQLTDALRELLKSEELYAISLECEGYDTGNVLSWIEANIALGLESPEFGADLRERLEALLGRGTRGEE
ncbi:UTP--glucose-1-phosphate uridylyltransferase GalU [Coriobacteriia bacterium Es71-Z0120]|uniref:UTP--glucose-1-phosphate uridylyltransferase GalU n=1 Tax=Parvivirga hydrogeniphila TaxID=2939460 RepID=UPI002260A172|nr:UTP--glucose-1-phosphate uridylyltransferase GalU [Parvivirga hydrogeniphila]MCL4079354.1 UTP--glucose-1-phosphate uridylyltransferase GalU [Parvivirga hydrogeniphila]